MYDNLRAAARLLPTAETFWTWDALANGSWAAYPEALLDAAWLNISIQGARLEHETGYIYIY